MRRHLLHIVRVRTSVRGGRFAVAPTRLLARSLVAAGKGALPSCLVRMCNLRWRREEKRRRGQTRAECLGGGPQ